MNRALASVPEFADGPLAGFEAYAKRVAERAEQQDRDGRLNQASIEEAQQLGLAALNLTIKEGGQGYDLPQMVQVIGRLGQSDSAVALILTMHLFHLEAVRQSRTWPEQARQDVIASAATKGGLINALRVEPEQGSPVRGGRPQTLAVKVPGGWRLSGRKMYSTGSTALDWGIVWATTEEHDGRLGEFLLPMKAAGVSIERSWDHLGQRGSESHDVVMEDVWLPDHYAVDLRQPDDWAVRRIGNLNSWLPILLAALYDGVAQAAVAWVGHWLNNRQPTNLGAPLATLPRMRSAVGEMTAQLQVNAALLHLAADQFSRDADTRTLPPTVLLQAPLVKYTVTQNAIALVNRAVELGANPALTRANPLQRHLRDVLCARVHHPQNDLILESCGTQALNLYL